MPAFGSYGFSATPQQAKAYRTQTPGSQPALSMPAYSQASGAAQPIATSSSAAGTPYVAPSKPNAVASSDPQFQAYWSGAQNNMPKPVGYDPQKAQAEALAQYNKWTPQQQSFYTNRSQQMASRRDPGIGTKEYADRVRSEGKNNPASPFYAPDPTPEQQAQSQANLAAADKKHKDTVAKSGYSQEAYDYLDKLTQGSQYYGSDASAAPSYAVYKEIAEKSGGNVDPSEAAYARALQSNQDRQTESDKRYNPMYGGQERTPSGGTPRVQFDMGGGANWSAQSALSGRYQPQNPAAPSSAAPASSETPYTPTNQGYTQAWNSVRPSGSTPARSFTLPGQDDRGNLAYAPDQYRPPAFQASYGGIDGSSSPQYSSSLRDALIDRLNASQSPNPDIQSMFGQAQQMVQNGWQNPFAQSQAGY